MLASTSLNPKFQPELLLFYHRLTAHNNTTEKLKSQIHFYFCVIIIKKCHIMGVGMKELSVDFRRKSRSCENKKIGYPFIKKRIHMEKYRVTMSEITRYKVGGIIKYSSLGQLYKRIKKKKRIIKCQKSGINPRELHIYLRYPSPGTKLFKNLPCFYKILTGISLITQFLKH